MIRVADIQRLVADRYEIPPEVMREPRPVGRRAGVNSFKVSHPRQAAMALAFQLTNHTKVAIGRMFGGRDHTTVLHAIREVQKRRRSDPKLDRVLHEVGRELTLQSGGAI